MTLPAALSPLGQYRQWIVYRAQPSATKPGKIDKIPVDWRTGIPSDAHDPSMWLAYAEALQVASAWPSHGVGFVYTDADPFWFLDIDNCLTVGGWSPLATELCTLMAGAAIEVSISGTGLHVIGAGKVPPHSSKNGALGLEFYHTGRFMALGTGAIGDATRDCTEAVATLVARYFERRAGTLDAAWSVGPVAEWRGPSDDDELIRRACNSKSAGSAFGNRASFAQLWDADAMALARAWPDAARGAGGYDASSADAALAQHLAFWSGKDCARIERLMRRSKLVRAKWTEHASYMQRTILQAVAQQADVLQDKPPEVPTAGEAVTAARDVQGETFLTPDDQKIMFAGCVYVASEHAIMLPSSAMYTEGRFNAMLGGFSYVLDRASGKMAKSPWHCFLDSRDVRFPKVAATEFRPDLETGAIWTEGGRTLVNSYVPIPTPSKQGNPAPFLDHLARLLPDANDRDILLAYMAAIVQYPGKQFFWAPLLQGCEGNGKTMLSRCIIEAIGREHCHTPKGSQLASRFNDWLDGKIFIAVEDLFPKDDDSIIEALTPMLTNEFQEIEGKGTHKATRRVIAKWMFNANKKDAIRKKLDGRRFAIFYTAQQSLSDLKKSGMTGDYFPNLYSWLRRDGYAIVANYLRNFAIPDALNPATHCHRAPMTSSTAEAIELGADALQEEVLEAITQGEVGFRDGWISSHFLDKLVREHNLESRYTRHRRTSVMAELGYFPHPGVPNGQVHNVCAPDGKKPRLFIKSGHPAEGARGAEVARLYSDAQTSLVAAQGLRLAVPAPPGVAA